VAGPLAASQIGARLGAGGGSVVEEEELWSSRELGGVVEGNDPVGAVAWVVGLEVAETTGGTRGCSGTRAADATSAASTAKVRPNATSIRRMGRRCSARWRGDRFAMGYCQLVRLDGFFRSYALPTEEANYPCS
jgi:hypothetical protein